MIRRAVVAAIVGWLLFGSAPRAVASCLAPPALEEALTTAKLAFVGTVVAPAEAFEPGAANTRPAGWAQRVIVRVDEVWRGPRLPTKVMVFGNGPDPRIHTSNDRAFTIGVRYLFVLDHHYAIEPGMPRPAADPGATRIPPPAGPPPTPPFTVSICNLIEPYTDEGLDRYRPADATVYPVEDTGDRSSQGRAAWIWVAATVGVSALTGLGGWALGRGRRN